MDNTWLLAVALIAGAAGLVGATVGAIVAVAVMAHRLRGKQGSASSVGALRAQGPTAAPHPPSTSGSSPPAPATVDIAAARAPHRAALAPGMVPPASRSAPFSVVRDDQSAQVAKVVPSRSQPQIITGGISLEGDFGRALSLTLQAPYCMFVTGKAGTGKSTLLKLLVEKTNKRVALLAPTGLAAVNIGGETIHSFFHFPPRPLDPDEIKAVREKGVYQSVQALLIDEVSMVRADLMDSIDRFMRLNGKDSRLPFGGVQVVLFGDVNQLPPVVASGEEAEFLAEQYESEFFFDADVFRSLRLEIVELTQVYRQSDPAFIGVLDAIRTGDVRGEDLELVNLRYRPGFDVTAADGYIILTTTNKAAREINLLRLSRLSGPEGVFVGRLTGEYPRKALPTDLELHLRPGAQVMFVKNDINKRWVNGTIGVVTGIEPDSVAVSISPGGSGHAVQVGPESWDILKHMYNRDHGRIETEVVGSFTQIPLRLAWAVTIHKSQGLTFDKVVIDLGKGAFAYGQTYVALSRCRSLEGIVLRRPIRMADVKTSPRVSQFLRSRTVYRPQADRGGAASKQSRSIGLGASVAPGSPEVAQSASRPSRSSKPKVCPHGVPRPYTCAICEPEKFKQMTGIG